MVERRNQEDNLRAIEQQLEGAYKDLLDSHAEIAAESKKRESAIQTEPFAHTMETQTKPLGHNIETQTFEAQAAAQAEIQTETSLNSNTSNVPPPATAPAASEKAESVADSYADDYSDDGFEDASVSRISIMLEASHPNVNNEVGFCWRVCPYYKYYACFLVKQKTDAVYRIAPSPLPRHDLFFSFEPFLVGFCAGHLRPLGIQRGR